MGREVADVIADIISLVPAAQDKAACAAVCRTWRAASESPKAWRRVVVKEKASAKRLTDRDLQRIVTRAGDELVHAELKHADSVTRLPTLPPSVTSLWVTSCPAFCNDTIVEATSTIPKGGLKGLLVGHNSSMGSHLTTVQHKEMCKRVKGGYCVPCDKCGFWMTRKLARGFVCCEFCVMRETFMEELHPGQDHGITETMVCRNCSIFIMMEQMERDNIEAHYGDDISLMCERLPFKCSDCFEWQKTYDVYVDDDMMDW